MARKWLSVQQGRALSPSWPCWYPRPGLPASGAVRKDVPIVEGPRSGGPWGPVWVRFPPLWLICAAETWKCDDCLFSSDYSFHVLLSIGDSCLKQLLLGRSWKIMIFLILSIFLHLEMSFCKLELLSFSLPPSFLPSSSIVLWTHGFIFLLICYITLTQLFFCLNWPACQRKRASSCVLCFRP